MSVLKFALAWLPGLVTTLLLISVIGPWPAAVVLVVGLLGAGHWLQVLIVGTAGYFLLDMSILTMGLAALYRPVYADVIRGLFELGGLRRMAHALAVEEMLFDEAAMPAALAERQGRRRWRRGQSTSKQHHCTPNVWCRHGQLRALRMADRAMRHGQPGPALGTYLTALAVHPTDGMCGRVLLQRAAEAAMDIGAARLAQTLGAAAADGLPTQPYLREAVIAARAHAVRALAAAEQGASEEAVRLVQIAQGIPHRNRSADRYVRLCAVVVRLRNRTAPNLDKAHDVIVAEMAGQQLTGLTPYEMGWISLRWGRELQRQDCLQLATSMYQSTIAIIERGGLNVTLHALAASPIADRNRRVAAVAAEAMCGILECADPSQEVAEGGLSALRVAVAIDDMQTAGRLRVAIRRANSKAELDKVRGSQPDFTPWLFADEHLQQRWAKVVGSLIDRNDGSTPAGTALAPPWPVRPDQLDDLSRVGAAATRIFTTLAQSHPNVFTPALAQVQATTEAFRTSGAIATSLPERGEAGATAEMTGTSLPTAGSAAAPDAHSGGATPPPTSTSHDAAAELNRQLAAPTAESASQPPADPDSADAPTSELGEVPGSLAMNATAEPVWLADAERVTEGRCVSVRLAWKHSRAMGHRHLGVEHLFLAALSDAECRHAAASAGMPVVGVRRAIDTVIGLGQTEPEGITPSAVDVLADAAVLSQHLGMALVRPWHIVLATLSAPLSVITAVLPEAAADEISIRLTCGANNPRLNDRSERQLGPGTVSFSSPARDVFAFASDPPGGPLITQDDLICALSSHPVTPPSVRSRAAALRHSSAPPLITTRRRSARLDAALHRIGAVAATWCRGVDLADILDVVLALSGEPAQPGLIGQPSPGLRSTLFEGAAIARASGHSYLGPEHLCTDAGREPIGSAGVWPRLVFTPSTKRLLTVAAAQTAGPVVTNSDLNAALEREGTRRC